jgi:hypothetical protein
MGICGTRRIDHEVPAHYALSEVREEIRESERRKDPPNEPPPTCDRRSGAEAGLRRELWACTRDALALSLSDPEHKTLRLCRERVQCSDLLARHLR